MPGRPFYMPKWQKKGDMPTDMSPFPITVLLSRFMALCAGPARILPGGVLVDGEVFGADSSCNRNVQVQDGSFG